MKYSLILATITVLLFVDSCKKEMMWDSAYIVGFNPCTATYSDLHNKGYILITIDSRDTVATYNLPKDLFDFPISYFSNFESNCLFPDSARFIYRIRIKYSITPEKEKTVTECSSDIFLGIYYQYVKFRQITLHSARKE